MDFREDLIRQFWSLFDQQKFEMVRSLLHEEFEVIWETSEEMFVSQDAFINVNRDYPGNWHTIPRRIELLDNGALSIVSVYSDDISDRFYVISFYEFKDKLIHKISEYWATVEKTPDWRKKYSIPRKQ